VYEKKAGLFWLGFFCALTEKRGKFQKISYNGCHNFTFFPSLFVKGEID